MGKWHLNGKFNNPAHPQPNDHGYNWWLATQNNAAPSHHNPNNFVRNGKPVGPWEGYSAILVVEEAIRWLREHRDRSKPFFLAVWTHEPHLPIATDPQFQKPYERFSDPEIRQHHGNVTQMDHAFGMLMQALEQLKLADNTFVFFTSDNGPEGTGIKGLPRGSVGGLRGRKRALYEGGIRVPGIARWPGHIPPNTTCDVPVIGSDLFPTVLRLAGVQPPKDRVLDGVDLTVRNGGHVLPENVTRDLPAAVEAIRAEGLDVHMITTRYIEASDEVYTVCAEAARLGIPYVRIGSHQYDEKRPLSDQIQRFTEDLRGLAAAAEKTPGPLAVAADAVVVRPLCLASTIVGSALFVVALPVAAASKSVKPTAEALVAKPAAATFKRPLGDLDAMAE